MDVRARIKQVGLLAFIGMFGLFWILSWCITRRAVMCVCCSCLMFLGITTGQCGHLCTSNRFLFCLRRVLCLLTGLGVLVQGWRGLWWVFPPYRGDSCFYHVYDLRGCA